MTPSRLFFRVAFVFALAAGLVLPAGASTFIHQSLDNLVAANSTIVIGEVLATHSYWNDEGTFILTDVRFKATDVLKGSEHETDFTVTLLGGTVDDLTTLIVGGAQLVPGKPYVLFLAEDDLPGAQGVRTIPGHAQGVFEVVKARDGLRAISQARAHPLLPDALGFVDPPGEAKGLLLADMVRSVRAIVESEAK